MLLAVQASGIIDHFASGALAALSCRQTLRLALHALTRLAAPTAPAVTPEELAQLAGEAGGSVRVELPELERILAAAPPSTTAAGGSAANTLRGLAAGFAVKCGVLGAVGGDEWGQRFRASLEGAGVDTSRLQVDAAKSTGRCAVLITPDGQRTMRTALVGAASLQAAAVRGAAASFQGVSWVSVTAFAYYAHGLVDAVVTRTRAAGAKLILHLAAKEVVRAFGKELDELLTSGAVSVLFANEDEAAQYMRGLGLPTDPGAAHEATRLPPSAAHACAPRLCRVGCAPPGDAVRHRGGHRGLARLPGHAGRHAGARAGRGRRALRRLHWGGRPLCRRLHVRHAQRPCARSMRAPGVPLRRRRHHGAPCNRCLRSMHPLTLCILCRAMVRR